MKGVMNSRTVSLMQRLGYVPIGNAQLSPKDQLPFVPVWLDLQQLSAPLLDYIQKQSDWDTSDSFHRLHCEVDEIVQSEGECLYVIQGDVAALQYVIQPMSSDAATVPLKHLFTQGDLITAEAAGGFCLQATSKVELAIITSAVLTAFSSQLWAAARI